MLPTNLRSPKIYRSCALRHHSWSAEYLFAFPAVSWHIKNYVPAYVHLQRIANEISLSNHCMQFSVRKRKFALVSSCIPNHLCYHCQNATTANSKHFNSFAIQLRLEMIQLFWAWHKPLRTVAIAIDPVQNIEIDMFKSMSCLPWTSARKVSSQPNHQIRFVTFCLSCCLTIPLWMHLNLRLLRSPYFRKLMHKLYFFQARTLCSYDIAFSVPRSREIALVPYYGALLPRAHGCHVHLAYCRFELTCIVWMGVKGIWFPQIHLPRFFARTSASPNVLLLSEDHTNHICSYFRKTLSFQKPIYLQ